MSKEVWAVVAIRPDGRVEVYGTPGGQAFPSESAAKAAAKRMGEEMFWSFEEAVAVELRPQPMPRTTIVGDDGLCPIDHGG